MEHAYSTAVEKSRTEVAQYCPDRLAKQNFEPPNSKNYLWKFPSVLLPIIPDETLLKTRLRKVPLTFLLLLGHTACSGVAAGLLSLYPQWELSQNVVCFL